MWKAAAEGAPGVCVSAASTSARFDVCESAAWRARVCGTADRTRDAQLVPARRLMLLLHAVLALTTAIAPLADLPRGIDTVRLRITSFGNTITYP